MAKMRVQQNEIAAEPRMFASARFSLTVGITLLTFSLYVTRVNMSVAMVCMINHTATEPAAPPNGTAAHQPQDNINSDCGTVLADNVTTTKLRDGPYSWDKELQGVILGSFFWGSLLTQLPGGLIATRFGGKSVIWVAMLLNSLAAIFSPLAAEASPYALMALRAIQGLAQGVVFPAIHTLWGKWAPPSQRGTLLATSSTGVPMGTIAAMSISGFLCASPGWQSIFYIFGGICVLFLIYEVIFIYNSPDIHPRISEEEKLYIQSSIGTDTNLKRKDIKIPWGKLLTSLPVWSSIVCETTSNWMGYTLLTNLPTYMREVLKFDIKSNGLLSAVPYMALVGVRLVAAFSSDYIIARRLLSVQNTRKLMYTLGSMVPAVFMVGVGFVDSDQPILAVSLLAIANGFTGFLITGVFVNPLDIAPPFAGTIIGLSNTAGTVPGIVAPYVVALITKNKTRAEWQNVFYMTAAVNTFGFLFFTIFAQGELQEWVKPYMALREQTSGGEEKRVEKPIPTAMVDTPSPVHLSSINDDKTNEWITYNNRAFDNSEASSRRRSYDLNK